MLNLRARRWSNSSTLTMQFVILSSLYFWLDGRSAFSLLLSLCCSLLFWSALRTNEHFWKDKKGQQQQRASQSNCAWKKEEKNGEKEEVEEDQDDLCINKTTDLKRRQWKSEGITMKLPVHCVHIHNTFTENSTQITQIHAALAAPHEDGKNQQN